MFVEQLRRAVEASPRAELPTVSALLWKAYATGTISEAEASELSEAIALKRPSRPQGSPHSGVWVLGLGQVPAWGDAAGGPRPAPCRPRSQAGSR